MSRDIDPYEALGLEPTASDAEIRERRLDLLRMLHPDRQQSESGRRAAEAQSKRINVAYDMLKDPLLRAEYDRTRRSSSATAPQPPHPIFTPSHLDFGALRPGARRTLTLHLKNDGGAASSAQVDLSVTGSWFGVDVSEAPSTDPASLLILTVTACGPGGEGSLNEWVSVTLDGVTTRADLRMTAIAPQRPEPPSSASPPRAETRFTEPRRPAVTQSDERPVSAARKPAATQEPAVPWAGIMGVVFAVGGFMALVAYMGARSHTPAIVAAAPQAPIASEPETVRESAPLAADQLKLGLRHYTARPFHLVLWRFGSRTGAGVDITLTGVAVRRDETVITFRIVGDDEQHSLLYEPPKPATPRRNSFGMPIVEDFEELYIVDNRGRRSRSTTGFEGGSQSSFNNYNLIRRITIEPSEKVDLTAHFPPLDHDVSSISFYSPALDGWQQQWWWKDIDLCHAVITAETSMSMETSGSIATLSTNAVESMTQPSVSNASHTTDDRDSHAPDEPAPSIDATPPPVAPEPPALTPATSAAPPPPDVFSEPVAMDAATERQEIQQQLAELRRLVRRDDPSASQKARALGAILYARPDEFADERTEFANIRTRLVLKSAERLRKAIVKASGGHIEPVDEGVALPTGTTPHDVCIRPDVTINFKPPASGDAAALQTIINEELSTAGFIIKKAKNCTHLNAGVESGARISPTISTHVTTMNVSADTGTRAWLTFDISVDANGDAYDARVLHNLAHRVASTLVTRLTRPPDE